MSPSLDPKIQAKATAIARQAWAVKNGMAVVRGSLRIPEDLALVFEEQSTSDRGATWAAGHLIMNEIAVLHAVLHELSGHNASYIIDQQITLLVGGEAFTANTHLEAILRAIAHYLPQEPKIFRRSNFDLEERLTELDLLE